MEYHDVITQKEVAVKTFDDVNWELFHDSRYSPIIHASRKGPMTVKDLEVEYNKIVEKQIKGMDLAKKEKDALFEKMKRKGKTLYKYLDFLIKNDVIMEAGKRVRTGQTAAETLYGRTAKFFVLSSKTKNKKPVFEDNEIWQTVGSIIGKQRNKTNVDFDCLIKLIETIYDSIQTARVNTFTKYSEELSKISQKITFEDLNEIAWILETFHIISSSSEFENKLKDCFK